MVSPASETPADPIEAFVALLEPAEKQADARQLDALFRRVTAQVPRLWGAGIIGYGAYRTTYASGRAVHGMRAGFSPRKAKHTLYLMGGYSNDLGTVHPTALLMRLGKHKTGKSCPYVNRLGDVDLAVLEQIIAADWEAMLRLCPDS